MKKQTILIVFVIAIVLLGFVRFKTLDYAKSSTVFFTNRAVTEKSVEFHGMLETSSAGFKGYDYKIEKNNMYIRILIGYFRLYETKWTGKVDIAIKDNFKGIDKIYLQGKDKKDQKLLWEKP